MIEPILMFILLVLACISVLSDNLRRSIVFLGAFSLTMALTYLYYNAPDVALAEAAIGVGLSTIMYLVALKKIAVYSIIYIDDHADQINDDQINSISNTIIKPLELFLERTEEIEPQIAYSNHSLESIIEEDHHDFIIYKKDHLTYFYGKASDLIFQDIIANMNETIDNIEEIRVVFRDEVLSDDAIE